MKNLLIPCFFALLTFTSALAEDRVWRDTEGNVQPQSESQKIESGFSGMLLVTPDKDWREKWNTPSDHIPYFSTASQVTVGGSVTTLIFFANPAVDDNGNALVLCDIKITRPDGTISANVQGAECHKGPILGGQYNVRLAAPVLAFVGESTDPLGEWITDVILIDSVRDVRLELRSRFTLVKDDT